MSPLKVPKGDQCHADEEFTLLLKLFMKEFCHYDPLIDEGLVKKRMRVSCTTWTWVTKMLLHPEKSLKDSYFDPAYNLGVAWYPEKTAKASLNPCLLYDAVGLFCLASLLWLLKAQRCFTTGEWRCSEGLISCTSSQENLLRVRERWYFCILHLNTQVCCRKV